MGLGDRIRPWLLNIFETLGLDSLAEWQRRRYTDWQAVNSLAALQQYARDHPGVPPLVLARRAKELGASTDEIFKMGNPATAGAIEDPSQWIAAVLQRGTTSPQWHELNEIFGALVFDPWLASLVGGEISPSAPEIEMVRRFLGTQATFEGLGSVVSSVGEVLTAGQVENLGRMFTDAKWLLGTCFTSWQSTSPIVESVILRPLQRLVNLTFRETDFTRSQWMDLYALGLISPSRLGVELGRLGYDNEKIGWLLDLAKREPSRADLIGMWNKGIITETLVVEGLRKQGYDQVWIDRFLRYYRKEETSEEKGAYLGTLRKAFKEQLIGEAEFREALKGQGRSDTAINLEIAVLKLDWEVDEKTTAKSDIRAAYMEDVIGRPEAVNWLNAAGFSAHTVTLLLDTWDRQRAPTFRQINKSELLKAWGTGVLTQPQTYQGLVDIGYDQQGATVLMETYRRSHMQTKPPPTYKLSSSAIMWAWHAEVIEEGEALDRLADLGIPDEEAGLIFETFQRLHPRIVAEEPIQLKKNDILEAYGRGIILEQGAFDRLLALGYTELDAGLLMDSYEARPEALPPEPTIASLIGATRRGVIDQAQLSQKLTVLGLRDEDVQFYVSYATTPLPDKTRSLSRTDITKLWAEGRHDRAWALERLLGMNYSPEDAEDILWLASPEIENTETFVLWAGGFINDDVAIAMWLAMGFTQEQIFAVIPPEVTP